MKKGEPCAPATTTSSARSTVERFLSRAASDSVVYRPPARSPRVRVEPGVARSTILLWLSGGASHIDTWDMKPDAPSEIRGEFRPIATSAPGIRLCEHLPRLARQAHHLAVVQSLGHGDRGTGDHHAGYYYNLTGHAPDPSFRALLNDRKPEPDDWPFLGSVVAAKRPPHPYLPQPITLPQKPGAPQYTRPGQFAARLGVQFDPVYVLGQRDKPLEFAAPALSLEGGITAERLRSRRALLRQIEEAVREADRSASASAYSLQQERAFALLSSSRTREAFDLSKEPEAVRRSYGSTVNGMSLLLARRLVEAGVPFVSVFWMEDPKLDAGCKSGGGWDTHGNNFNCLREHLLPEFDRGFAALLEDLSERGLLDETLVMVNSEMGARLASAMFDPEARAERAAITGPNACRSCWRAAGFGAVKLTALGPDRRLSRRPSRRTRRYRPHSLSRDGDRRPDDHGPARPNDRSDARRGADPSTFS